MEAINIYTYSRIQEDMATEFENIFSQKSKKLGVNVQEFAAIKTLVLLLDIEIEIKNFENFFASFTIEQIVTIAKAQQGDKNGQKFWSWYTFNCRNPYFFDWEGDGESNHVGIVERCEGGIVYTVEENSDDAVRERCYPINFSSTMGY
jgi:hypothetical protein